MVKEQNLKMPNASNFLKMENLLFNRNYEFSFESINTKLEKLAGAELKFNFNLNKLIDLQVKKSNRSVIRQPIHEIEVQISLFERKITKLFNNKKNVFLTHKLLTSKTIKINNNASQREFFRQVNETSQQTKVFDITKTVRKWLLQSKSSGKLHIEFKINLKTNSHVYSLENDAIKLKNLWKQNPTLVVYLNDGKAKKIQEPVASRIQKNVRNQNCGRKAWKINFKDIGWDKFIIRPLELNAFYCNGLCEGPFDNSFNVTNHAIMQYFAANSGYYNFLPKICCVPTSYLSEYFLFYDSNNNIVVKLIDDIVVSSCGCR